MKKPSTQAPKVTASITTTRSSRSRAKKVIVPKLPTKTINSIVKPSEPPCQETIDDIQHQATAETMLRDVLTELKSIRNIVQLLTSENVQLKSDNQKMKSELNQIFKDMDFLHSKLNNIEQNDLSNNLEICGVPAAEQEDLGEVMRKLFDHTEFPHNAETITNVYRKKKPKHSGQPGAIIATFNNAINKSNFIQIIKGKKLSSSFLGVEYPKPIYLNDHLTKHNKYLFYLARDLRRQKLIKYAWVDHGTILMKTDDNTDSMIVKNVTTIDQITEKNLHESNK
jgi:regulator of replication initiation timing